VDGFGRWRSVISFEGTTTATPSRPTAAVPTSPASWTPRIRS